MYIMHVNTYICVCTNVYVLECYRYKGKKDRKREERQEEMGEFREGRERGGREGEGRGEEGTVGMPT